LSVIDRQNFQQLSFNVGQIDTVWCAFLIDTAWCVFLKKLN